MNNTKYLNVQALKSHFDGDEEMIADLIEMFESEYSEILNNSKIAIESKNYSALELSAHTLKGMISNFFAEELKIAAQELETMGRNSELINAEILFDKLLVGIPKLIEEVKAI